MKPIVSTFHQKNLLIFCIFIILLPSPVFGMIYGPDGAVLSENLTSLISSNPSLLSGNLPPGEVVFFTNSHCGACTNAKEFLDTYIQAHPEIALRTYDIFNNTENRSLFEEYKKKYNHKFLSTPSIMIGNITLEGSHDIKTHLGEVISLQSPLMMRPVLKEESDSQVTSGTANEIPLILIIGAGLLDGINPCAFAVLVILLVYLMTQKSRKSMISAGLVYTAAVFIFYYLSGVGIFTVVQTTGMTTSFSLAAGFIALVAGILMIKDSLFPGERPSLAIPSSQNGLINRIMKKATLPAAFILGILVGMFELPCTGGIYLSIISMISLKTDLQQALGYLAVYNAAFILPLLVILTLVIVGLPPERVNEFRIEQRRLLRGIIGVVLLICALVILSEVLV